jgi:hypothetical protein
MRVLEGDVEYLFVEAGSYIVLASMARLKNSRGPGITAGDVCGRYTDPNWRSKSWWFPIRHIAVDL